MTVTSIWYKMYVIIVENITHLLKRRGYHNQGNQDSQGNRGNQNNQGDQENNRKSKQNQQ